MSSERERFRQNLENIPPLDILFGLAPAVMFGAVSAYAVWAVFAGGLLGQSFVAGGLILLAGLLGLYACASLIAAICTHSTLNAAQARVYGTGLVCGVVMAGLCGLVTLFGAIQEVVSTAAPYVSTWLYAAPLALVVSVIAEAVKYIRIMGAIRRNS